MKVFPGSLFLLACAIVVTSTASAQASTSLTIYNDGRVLVRKTLPLDIPKGASTQRAVLGDLDPATIFSLDSAVQITGASYDPATDQAGALRRAIGRTLTFRIWTGKDRDSVSATVLGVDPERYRLADGSVVFALPGTPVFPADVVVVNPVANLALQAAAARKSLPLGFFTGGASWQASYQVILGGKGARVQGTAVITSATLRAEDAEVQLLAGSVSRAQQPGPAYKGGVMMVTRERVDMSVSEQRVGEFHLYTLPGRVSLLPGVTTTAALFDPVGVPFEKAFTVRGQLPYYGYLSQEGGENQVPVSITYTLKRPRKTSFGDRPLPGGIARLFEADSGGRLQLVGEAAFDHTAAGEDLRLDAGTAFDLTAKRVQTSFSTTPDKKRTVATADYQVTLANATDAAVTIDVLEERSGDWSVLSSSVPAEKLSSTRVRFRVPVPAGGTATLTYRVRATW